jgi:chemotaxis protein methyltransferase CheR
VQGTYSTEYVSSCQKNYANAGGIKELSSYFKTEGRKSRVDQRLRDHIVFTRHNLVTDGSFNEFNVILCRNVFIYFTRELRDRVLGLLYGSLTRFGLLALGLQETLRFTAFEKQFKALDEVNRLYRRKS